MNCVKVESYVVEGGLVVLKRDGPCAETTFRLSEKRTSPFESAGVSA
jgi:hypothetical protein